MIRRPPRPPLLPCRTLVRSAGVNVGGGLEVVGVGAEATPPALGEYAPGSIIHDLPGGASGTLHLADGLLGEDRGQVDRKSTRLNSSHANISYAVFCLKKKIM